MLTTDNTFVTVKKKKKKKVGYQNFTDNII